MSNQESTPLLGNAGESNGYYFLNGEAGTTTAVRDTDGGEFVEAMPEGANADEFEPKVLGAMGKRQSTPKETPTEKQGLFAQLFGSKKQDVVLARNPSMIKKRTAPIKVEPKVFFANERTFLAWMHIAIILAGASIAILAFSGENQNPGSEIYGIVMLPVAVAFIVYSMYQYVRRAYMIRNKHPGPYDDTVGPTVLAIMLMLSIVCQFAIKLYSMAA